MALSSCPRLASREPRRSGRVSPRGDPPDPPFEEGAALNGRPEGGRRAPAPARTLRNSPPAKPAGADLGRGAAPAVFPGPGWCRSSAPPARALLRARGGRWLSPGRGPAARGAGAVNGLLPSGGETGENGLRAVRLLRMLHRHNAPLPHSSQGKDAPVRKLVHFPVKFACPPPPL